MNSIFISHCHSDRKIAEVIAYYLENLSNENIRFWFSSDIRPNGGMEPGNVIFDNIIKNINDSLATIVLITPQSINRPWIYFESGMAQGKDSSVIPVCVGIGRNKLTSPLSNYYCYQLSDYNSLTEFIVKLFGKVNLSFHHELHHDALTNFISSLQDVLKNFVIEDNTETEKDDILNIESRILSHIDKRFSEAFGSFHKQVSSYIIPIEISIGKNKGMVEYIEINEYDTIQRVLDKIYYLLGGSVKPYSYMDTWVLKEKCSEALMIIYEISSLIPAKYVFQQNLKWEVVNWDVNYKAKNSRYPSGILTW